MDRMNIYTTCYNNMMVFESWFILAVASAVFSGLFTFSQKIGTQMGFNSSQVTRWILFGQLLSSLIYFYWFDYNWVQWEYVLWMGIVVGILYAMIHWLRALSLEYIDTAIYFPLNKFLGPLLVAIIGIVIVGDSLEGWDYLGIVLGAMVPLMLLDRLESGRQKNLSKGLQIMLLATLISAGAIFAARATAISDGSIGWFVIIQSIFGILFLYANEWLFHKEKPARVRGKRLWQLIALGTIGGSMTGLSIFTILNAFEIGFVSVIYTINSFYILIPIVLSVWLYNEHMNLRKALAIGFSIVAVIFFQI